MGRKEVEIVPRNWAVGSTSKRKSKVLFRAAIISSFIGGILLLSLLLQMTAAMDNSEPGSENQVTIKRKVVAGGSSIFESMFREAGMVYSLIPECDRAICDASEKTGDTDEGGTSQEEGKEHSHVSFSYVPFGSGKGVCRIKDYETSCDEIGKTGVFDSVKHLDLAISEVPLSDEDYIEYPDLKAYPIMAVGIVPVYNIEGLPRSTQLVFHKRTLSRIFRGNITTWDHEEILQANPLASKILKGLEDKVIKVFVRSDQSSGATKIWKSALAGFEKVFKEKIPPTSDPNWNGVNVFKRERNSGIAGAVSYNKQSIGYVSLNTAKWYNMSTAAIIQDKNSEEVLEFFASVAKMGKKVVGVQASYRTIWQALNERLNTEDYFKSNIHGALGTSSWPIVGYNYAILRTNMPHNRLRPGSTCEQSTDTVKFLSWFLKSESVNELALDLGYVPLPEYASDDIVKAMQGDIYCDGQLAYSVGEDDSSIKVLTQSYSLYHMFRYQKLFDHPSELSDYSLNTTVTPSCSHTKEVFEAHDIYAGMNEVLTSPGPILGNLTYLLNNNYAHQHEIDSEITSLPYGLTAFSAVYNIPGFEGQLKVKKDVLLRILGKHINMWNHEDIVADNPGLQNISMPIQVFSPSSFVDCYVAMTPPDQKELLEARKFQQSVFNYGIPRFDIIPSGQEVIHVREAGYAIAATIFSPQPIQGEKPSYVQILDNEAICGGVDENKEWERYISFEGTIGCYVYQMYQVNLYVRTDFDFKFGVKSRSANANRVRETCLKAEKTMAFLSHLQSSKARVAIKNHGVFTFNDQIIQRNLLRLNGVRCDGISVICKEKYDEESMRCTLENCKRKFRLGSCDDQFFSKRKVWSFFIEEQDGRKCQNSSSNSIPVEIDCNYVPPTSSLGHLVATLSFFGIFCEIFLAVGVYFFRTDSNMLAGQPLYNFLILMGNIMCLMYIPLSLGTHIPLVECYLRFAFLSIGITMTFSAIFCKTFRVFYIFSNKTLIPTKLSGRDLLPYWFALVFGDSLGFFLNWVICHPDETKNIAIEWDGTSLTTEKCVGYSDIFLTVTYSYKILLLIAVIVLTWETKRVTSIFSEAKLSAVITYNGFVLGMVALIMNGAADLSTSQKLFMESILIMLHVAGSSWLLIGLRIYSSMGFGKQIEGKTKRASKFFAKTWSSLGFQSSSSRASELSKGDSTVPSETSNASSASSGSSDTGNVRDFSRVQMKQKKEGTSLGQAQRSARSLAPKHPHSVIEKHITM